MPNKKRRREERSEGKRKKECWVGVKLCITVTNISEHTYMCMSALKGKKQKMLLRQKEGILWKKGGSKVTREKNVSVSK
jgi:hypothetical protein